MKRLEFVEVFTTNVANHDESEMVIGWLMPLLEASQVSVDLGDVDRVLRIASPLPIDGQLVMTILESLGVEAEVMPDEVLQGDLRSWTH